MAIIYDIIDNSIIDFKSIMLAIMIAILAYRKPFSKNFL